MSEPTPEPILAEKPLFTILSANAAVTGIVKDRIYPGNKPANLLDPSLAVGQVIDGPIPTLGDPDDADRDGSLVIACFHPSYDGARKLSRHVAKAVHGQDVNDYLFTVPAQAITEIPSNPDEGQAKPLLYGFAVTVNFIATPS